MAERSQVRNAADPHQVRRADRRERDQDEVFRAALAIVMQAPAGRSVLWGLMKRAGIYQSVFSGDALVTAYRSGRQDFGHELIALLVSTSESDYLLMEREARFQEQRDNVATDAAFTKGAIDDEDQVG